jgi:small subunit ribosomal protein S1
MQDDFDALLRENERSEKAVKVGDRLEATVIRIGADDIYLDLGTRTEGLLSKDQLELDGHTLAVGDKVNVYLTSMRSGAAICTRSVGATASRNERTDDKGASLEALREAFDTGMPVEGTVKETNKGGFTVTVLGQRAFCPISQIDNQFCADPTVHVGHTYTFEITKFEEGGRNLVLSRRRIRERESQEKKEAAWQTLEVGQTFDGTVSSLRPFGAFVNIGGVDGLVHVSEISHERVNDPSEVLEVGQRVTVAIKELDRDKGRISLSLKALAVDPWDDASSEIIPGRVYKGTVRRLAKFGAFVELRPGVEGLIHVSQMAADRRVNTPREMVREGQEVDVRVLEVSPADRRISLSMVLEAEDDDWRSQLPAQGEESKGGFGSLGELLGKALKKS